MSFKDVFVITEEICAIFEKVVVRDQLYTWKF